jgi:hypothetical protein
VLDIRVFQLWVSVLREAQGGKQGWLVPPMRLPLLRVSVPVRTVSEANQREHWTVRNRRKKGQQEATLFVLCAVNGDSILSTRAVAVWMGVDVHLTRYASRALDSDNLVGSMKHVRDAIAFWIGVDDGDPRVGYQVGQRVAAKPSRTKIFGRDGGMRQVAAQCVVIEIYRRIR